MPSTSPSRQPTSKIKPSFDTLRREHSFKHPSSSTSEYPALQEAVQPHIDSFNAITADNLLEIAIKDTGKKTVFDHKGNQNGGRGNRLTFWVEGVQLSRPALTSRERTSLNRRLYPSEVCMPCWNCGTKFKSRERKTTYKGVLRAKFVYQLNDGPEQFDIKELGEIPVMVRVHPIR
jgi:DNA-directed RNA polymerase I subunit RPA2